MIIHDPLKITKPIIFDNEEIQYQQEYFKVITNINVPDIKENAYKISNYGRIYSNLTNTFLNPFLRNSGYLAVALQTNNGSVKKYVHRLVLQQFCPIDNPGTMQVNHKNGNKIINTIWNLEWMTAKENSQHAVDNGLHLTKGENCNFAKITNAQAEQIAILLLEGKTSKEIANIIGCGISTVETIREGRNWKDIYNKYNLSSIKNDVDHWDDNDIHAACLYMQNNKNTFSSKNELYRNTIMFVFKRKMTAADRIKLIRYESQISRKDITTKYNF